MYHLTVAVNQVYGCQRGNGGSNPISQQERLMGFDRTTKNVSSSWFEEKRLGKLSVAGLLMLNVDKLSTALSLIGLLDLQFQHVILTKIHSWVRVKLLRDVKACQKLSFFFFIPWDVEQ